MAVVTNPLGTHVILDLYDCEAPVLDSVEKVEEILKKAAEVANATVIGSTFRKFSNSMLNERSVANRVRW